MKTIQEIQDEILTFQLPAEATGRDISNLLKILDDTLQVIQKLDSSVRRNSKSIEEMSDVVGMNDDHPEADCQNEI